MSAESLIEDLRNARQGTPVAPPISVKGFEPGVQYDLDGRPSVITTAGIAKPLETSDDYQDAVESLGIQIPEGFTLVLQEARYDPAAWTREGPGLPAVTQPVWRYRFKVVADAAWSEADLSDLIEEAKKTKKTKAPRSTTEDTLVIALSDCQFGKVDIRGGTLELLQRLEVAKEQIIAQVKKVKPAELVLIDVGDAVEMFESAPGADRNNDLQVTEQIRVWRRVFWSWVKDLAPLCGDVKVISVPSNHCRVRRGKQALSHPNDDWGLEVLSQISDIAAENPEAYGHVKFFSPDTFEESLALELVGGKVLGAAHGHQKNGPAQLGTYLAGQALGRTPIGSADITVFGHFHNLRVETIGNDRWFFISPTIDSGSSWFSNNNGTESRSGVLTFVVDEDGWKDLFVAWAD